MDGDFVARYEDRPFRENVEDSIFFAGMTVVQDACDVLAVCCPPDGIQTDWENPGYAEAFEKQADAIARLAAQGKRVYLLDVTRANGGSLGLMRALQTRMDAGQLAGYSAWNTASNALGTILAQIISDQLAGAVQTSFLWERLLDDLCYQGAVRAELYAALQAAGEDPFHISDHAGAVKALERMMADFVRTASFMSSAPSWRISLPWPRAFECLVHVPQGAQ